MATITVKNLDKYADLFSSKGLGREGIIKYAVYDGAKIIADGVRDAIEGLHALPNDAAYIAIKKHIKGNITVEQQKGLLDGLFLEPITNHDGYISTRIGFAGYNSIRSDEYPNGQPNAMIARSVEGGTSARRKQPFVRPTVNKLRKQAEQAMSSSLDEKLKETMKGLK